MLSDVGKPSYRYLYLFLFILSSIFIARLTHPVEELQTFLANHPTITQLHLDDLILGAMLGGFIVLMFTLYQMNRRYAAAAECSKVKNQHYELLVNLPIAVAELDGKSMVDISNHNFSELIERFGEGEINYVIDELTERVRAGGAQSAFIHKHRVDEGEDEVFINWMLFLQDSGRYLLMGLDKSHLHKVTNELSISRQILEQTPIGVMVADKNMCIEYANSSFERVTGYAFSEVQGCKPSILQSGKHGPDFYQKMHGQIKRDGCWQGEIWNKRKNGEIYLEWLSITALKNEQGDVSHYIGMFSEITAQEHVKQKLRTLAYFDSLTSLANRSYLEEQLEDRLKQEITEKTPCVLFIDMDGFKRINDSLGHEVGDELLIAFSKRLKNNIRSNDIVSRWGGDEFIVGFDSSDPRTGITNICTKLIDAMQVPFWIKGKELNVTISIGACIYGPDSYSVEELIRNADTAMYLAKRKGKCRFEIFSPELHQELAENIEIEGRLRTAIKLQKLDVAFQPQVSCQIENQFVAVEALARWQDEQLGQVPPVKFIGVAESTGLMNELGKVIIRKAFTRFSKVRAEGHDMLLSVNLSATQLLAADIVDYLVSEARIAGLPNNKIKLEITEDLFIEDTQTSLEKLKQLKGFGFKISLDDFGTGYSSLSYLKDFEIDELKIDRSFVTGIENSVKNQGIIKAILSMTDFMGINCVVEGVENDHQRMILEDLGCSYFQGFLFARPVTVDVLLKRLALPEKEITEDVSA